MSAEWYASKVTGKGQVTIPKEIRRRLGVREGEYVVWKPRGQDVVVERAAIAPTGDFERLATQIAKRFARKGITREDVEEAIRWAREKA